MKAVALGVILVCTASVIGIFGVSEWKLRRTRAVPLAPLPVKPESRDLSEGLRMAKIVGCWAGCHGETGEGGSVDMEGYYRVTAPTLSSVIPKYGDAELVRLIRFGIKRNGSTVLGMVCYTFYPLADQDLANIIAHLRSQPAAPEIPRERSVTWAGRLKLALGTWQVAADQVDARNPRWGELPRTNSFERGRYLASITCSECHGRNFGGNEFADNTYDGGPSLAIVAAYGPEEFRRLMRTGVPIGGRELRTMGWVAREAFSLFTDQEIDDIRNFLREHHGIHE
jgi:cytochrome c553